MYVVKSGRDRERSELSKGLTDLCNNTGNATGDQILLSLKQRRLWGDPRAVSQYPQGGYWKDTVRLLQPCPVGGRNKMGTS